MEIPELAGPEAIVRTLAFFGVFGVMALWEVIAPRRVLARPKSERWVINITITAVNTLLARLLMPGFAWGVALMAKENGWGLLYMLDIPVLAAFLVTILLLDLAIYAQHVAFHHIPMFWRLHRVHHLDLDVDVTTGLRFHPGEIILSLFIKGAVIIAIGADPIAVVLFEIVLNASAMFNHANVRLFKPLDAGLRMVVVTPDMHRVHHSVIVPETNSNFGFFLSAWDRIFRTYKAQPEKGHPDMKIGQIEARDHRGLTLLALIAHPFLRWPR